MATTATTTGPAGDVIANRFTITITIVVSVVHRPYRGHNRPWWSR